MILRMNFSAPAHCFRQLAGGVFFAALLAAVLTGCQSRGTQSAVTSVQSPPAAYPQRNLEASTVAPEPLATTSPAPGSSISESPGGLPEITAKAAILVDNRGRILFEKNSEMRLSTASTQKLLVGILIADAGNLDQTIVVSASDTNCEPSKIGVQAGQTYRRGDLLKAMLVKSSNDLARCLARNHSGSEQAFASAMNAKASQIGMYDSFFTNSSGLPTPEGQYSTAKDLAILGSEAMRRPVIRDAVRTRALTFRFSNGTTKTIYNTNEVLGLNPYCDGCKTGYTAAAGRCLISSATDGRRSVIAVLLGSRTPNVWTESDALLSYGLQR